MRCFAAAAIVVLAFGSARADSIKEEKPAAGGPDMKAMMEACAKAGALNENHKRLEAMVGTWDLKVKMWMDPSAPPQESTGTEVTKSVMDGRYFESETKGTMEMPGPDGKLAKTPFIGKGLTGYDNLKKKFVNTWIDSMSTGIFMSEGTYDEATKSFTYRGDMDDMMAPGTKVPIRIVIRIAGPDSHVFDWHETRGGKEVRTMEITYSRKK